MILFWFMSCIWIASYNDGAYRSRSAKYQNGIGMQFACLNPVRWLRAKLVDFGGDDSLYKLKASSSSSCRPSTEFVLHSIVTLEPGIVDAGILTQWSKEELLMLDYYNSPRDAYSCTITNVAQVHGAPLMVNGVTRKRQFHNSKRIQVASPLFILVGTQ